MRQEKTEFVKGFLEPLLKATNPYVEECAYWQDNFGEELVSVQMVGGCYIVNVTADSLIALAADVINFMKHK